MMQIEAGKFYRTRDGRKVGPMYIDYRRDWPAYAEPKTPNNEWMVDGRWTKHTPEIHENDIVSEWCDEPEGPVREVTRKEIVPGVYGRVEVSTEGQTVTSDGVSIWLPRNARWTAAELRAAAATLTEIADALEPKP